MAAFSGGKKAEQYLKDLAAKFGVKPTLQVGFLAGATYPDGTSVASVAAVHVFGAPAAGIPMRDFMRPTVRKGERTWGAELATLVKANDGDVVKALGLMGQRIKGQIQEAIIELQDPPLKPATVVAKGFAKPLIDTSHMLNSVDYQVDDK